MSDMQPQGFTVPTTGEFEGLEGGREQGGAGELGGRDSDATRPDPGQGYGAAFAAQVETEVERAAPRAGRSNLGEVAGETGGPGAQSWEGPLP